jgi:hypothetical protein
MSAKATARPRRPKQRKPSKLSENVRASIEAELHRMKKTNALLTATQFAAGQAAEFDVSDAVAAIVERVDQHIEALDRLRVRLRFDIPVKQLKEVARPEASESP